MRICVKPKIAVVNSSSELAICFRHLDGVAAVVKEAIREAGGLPFEIRTTAPSDFIVCAAAAAATSSSARDLIVNDMEIAVEGAQLDGMICLSSCDKTPPAHLMAAGRFDIPTILVICGYQPSGDFDGEHVDIEDVFLGVGQAQFGKLEHGAAARHVRQRDPRPRRLLRGWRPRTRCTSSARRSGWRCRVARRCSPNSPRMFEMARRSGSRIVEMVQEDLRPREIMTPGAFRNAAAAVLSVSGSINCIKHLQADGRRVRLDLDVYGLFDELGDEVPVLSAVRPNGADTIDAFEAAGGTQALLKQLQPLLDGNALTVTGRTLAGNLAERSRARRRRDPAARSPVLDGAGDRDPARFARARERDPQARSPATRAARALHRPRLVYDDGLEAIAGDPHGEVEAGKCARRPRHGPRGGPAMAGPASMVLFALDSADLADDVAFVTDGQLSGLCLKGLTVAEVSPEAADRRPARARRERRPDHDRRRRPLARTRRPRAGARRAARARRRTAARPLARLPLDLPAHRPADVDRRGPRRKGLTRLVRRGGEQQVGCLLADHQRRRIRVAGGDERHDRRIGDAQPVDAPDAELRIDDRPVVHAHAAGADLMVVGDDSAAHVVTQLGPVRTDGPG